MPRRNTTPAPAPNPAPGDPTQAKRKHSTLKRIVYIVVLLIALSLILQVLGLGVVRQQENDTMIEQPHAE